MQTESHPSYYRAICSSLLELYCMKYLRFGLITLVISYILLVIVANRGLYFAHFDVSYWKDKYEHSQWNLPLSVRTLGDDGLYLYEGYRLVHGGDPTLLNAEVPPLGKYIIGWTITLFGNPYWFGFIVNVALLVGTFFLTKRLTRSSTIAWLAVLLLATDPLFTNQYALTMLDSLQALFLLFYCLFILRVIEKKTSTLHFAAFAGIALGFFSETKFPLLVPIPFILGAWQIWQKTRSMLPLCALIFGFILGYLLPYAGYFYHGHSLIEWLKVQKWIVAFYLASKSMPTYGSALVNMGIGSFQNIFSRAWQVSPHWSPLWPVLLFASVISFFRAQKEKSILLITLLTLSILSFYMIIPFWTRYLVLILPFFYMLLAFVMRRLTPKVLTIVATVFIATNMLWSIPTFFPTPDGMLSLFTYSWKNNFFSDMYEDLTMESQKNWDRTSFREFGLNTVYDGEIEKVEISYTLPHLSRFTTSITIPARITYITRHLGPFDIETTIPLKKENNRWKVMWDWSLYLPDLSRTTHLETRVIEGKRGEIIASDKAKLANDFPSMLISITPKNVEPARENEMLEFIEHIFSRNVLAVFFHQRIYGNTLNTRPIPIGVIPRILVPEEMAKLISFQGLTLTPHLSRRIISSDLIKIGNVANAHFYECCSRLYTTSLYDGIEGVEKSMNTILKGENGGTLILKDTNGNTVHTFLEKTKKDGGNVQL